MATTPSFTSTPRIGSANVAAANTNRDGTGTITALLTGAAAGTKVTSISAQAAVTTTAGMVRIFLSTDTGSTWRLFDELSIAAATASASVKATRITATYNDLVLPDASHRLGCTTHNAESINVVAVGGDLT
jgi:hypothetical protein